MPNHNEIYNHQAEMYESLISKQPELSWIINEIRPFHDLNVLDLGAGTGRLSVCMASKVKSLISTDRSRAMLDILEQNLKAQHFSDHCTTVLADHRNMPIETSSIDLVVSGWSICYLVSSSNPDWKQNLASVMSEINRVLREQGTVIIFETFGTGTETPDPPEFLQPYYRALTEEYGFEHRWIRLDYQFSDVEEAVELTKFFFGVEKANKVLQHKWITVPECAGVWWRHGK